MLTGPTAGRPAGAIGAGEVDVLVVGGGPAGLVAGTVTARAGYETLIVEREAEIGSPVRTSGAIALGTMREFSIPERHYHPLATVRFVSPRESAVFVCPEPWGCVIDVRGTYRHLASRAADAGAAVRTGIQALAPALEAGVVAGCALRGPGGTAAVRSRILIDAGGYRAEMSKAAGLHPGFDRFGVGAEYEVVAPRCRQDELVLIVGNRYAPSGYAWVFPWGGARVRVGVGLLHADTREDPRKLLERFLHEIERFGVELGDYEITEHHFGLVPARGLARRLAGDGIMAVGDAAGVATLVAGEGIRLSMVSGRLAGEVAVGALSRGRRDAAALGAYEERFRAAYGRDLRIGGIINRRMASWSDATWDEWVRALRDVPPELFVAGLQSHLSARAVLSWALGRPRLWPLVARSLAKGVGDLLRSSRP